MIVVLGSWWHSPVIPTVSSSTSSAWLSNPILAPLVVDVSLDDTLSDSVWSQCEEAFVFLTENCLFLTCALVLIGAFLCSLSSPAFQMLSPCQRFPPHDPLTLVTASFVLQKPFDIMESHFSVFTLVLWATGMGSREPWPMSISSGSFRVYLTFRYLLHFGQILE